MADYLYGSAEVRVLETRMIGRERIARLLETKNAAEAYQLLWEYGVKPVKDDASGKILREETLLTRLRDAYREAEKLAPDSKALRLWLYPYDCNNLKAAIKAAYRKIDPASMMFDFGTVPAEDIVRMTESGSYRALPERLCNAAADTAKALAETRDPQKVDLILDRACYAEMLACAEEEKNASVLDWVRVKIDMTDLMTAVRILRMNNGAIGRILLSDALLEGGSITRACFEEWFAAGEKALWEGLRRTRYKKLADAVLGGKDSLSAIECAADNYLMSLLRELRFTPLGVEVMAAFLLGHEYEVKNLRILLSGKEAGIPNATIVERMRDSYV